MKRRTVPIIFREFITEKTWKKIAPEQKKVLRDLNSWQKYVQKIFKGHENCCMTDEEIY